MKQRLLFLIYIPLFWLAYLYVLFLRIIIRKRKTKPTLKSCLYLDSFPFDSSSGHKYRVRNWMHILEKAGCKTKALTHFESAQYFFRFTNPNELPIFLAIAMLRRCHQILKSRKYECVIVRRELLLFNDYGNLFMDKFLLKLHPNAILDFDDDIAAAKDQPRKITNWYGRLLLEDGNKFNNTLRLYKRFIVASNYLKNKVLHENPTLPPENILVIPTCVDYDQYPPKQYPAIIEKITFGWIGGDHNYALLDTLLPIFNQLSGKYSFKLLVIGGSDYVPNTNFELEFVKWSMETEVENLYRIDVGLMPLTDSAENRGKGGFKLIQYMGLGIVSVASAITINCEIVEHGVDSFLVSSDEEWQSVFTNFLEKKVDFADMGKRACKKIMGDYTFTANTKKYIDFVTATNHTKVREE